jgi:hypothetical protein
MSQETDRGSELALLWKLNGAVWSMLVSHPDRCDALRVILAEASRKVETVLRVEANKPWHWMRAEADELQRRRLPCEAPPRTGPPGALTTTAPPEGAADGTS